MFVGKNEDSGPKKRFIVALTSFGALGGLALWHRREMKKLKNEIARLKEATGPVLGLPPAETVASECIWKFMPNVRIQKAISPRFFFEIERISELKTELISDDFKVVLKITSPENIWFHWYTAVLSAYVPSDFEFKPLAEAGFLSKLFSAVPQNRLTLKFQWLQLMYDITQDRLTIDLQLGPSLTSITLSTFSDFVPLLKEAVAKSGADVAVLGQGHYQITKTGLARKWRHENDKTENEMGIIMGFFYYLKYAHMTSPELFRVLSLQLPQGHPWKKKLVRLQKLVTVSCQFVPAKSIELYLPAK